MSQLIVMPTSGGRTWRVAGGVACAGVLAVSAFALVACSAPEAEGGHATAGDVSFTGPYAQRFADEYDADRTSDLARQILATGEITDADVAEVRTRFADCLESEGITLDALDGNTMNYTVTVDDSNDAAEGHVTDCEYSSGLQPVYYLDLEMRGNPEHRDLAEVMTECFIDKGVVPSDYTVADYERDNADYTFPFAGTVEGDVVYSECLDDPLGLIAQAGE
ncbi:hypothetical protein [Microbacterium indicum]|uniref:hypothetical protein n=1 Tax=Microbacterium indicum TaxID=358100 RepID=UPI0012EB3900|nr:hypothetical protein [Microbacterium indicum]